MSVEGLEQFRRRWGAVPDAVRAAVATELEAIATALVADMRRLAPKDKGTLAESIGWTWGDAPKGTMVVGTVGGREYGTLRITIYAGGGDAFHATFQEFGTVAMSANPFFYPAWRARRRGVKSRITRAINKALMSV
mgnify:CR=1 FL=1